MSMVSTEARMGTYVWQEHSWNSISVQASLFASSKMIKHLLSKAGHDSIQHNSLCRISRHTNLAGYIIANISDVQKPKATRFLLQ